MSQGYMFQDWYIRSDMVDALEEYKTNGVDPGGFLRLILENNFVEACGAADMHNLINIQAYASYLYNEMPREIWGSKKAVNDWVIACYDKRIRG